MLYYTQVYQRRVSLLLLESVEAVEMASKAEDLDGTDPTFPPRTTRLDRQRDLPAHRVAHNR
jgi:hypothetical protein